MIELGLQRIGRLLSQTPLSWRAIHVAGTNGKGSICAYVSAMLDVYNKSGLRQRTQHEPLRHGRYTSPHLVDRWDCISINQETVAWSVFSEVEQRVLHWNKEQSIGASEFELLTATAFELFTEAKLDVAVVEVGMGGRLDATNIIGQADGLMSEDEADFYRPSPLVTAISSIGLDHQEFLGNTIKAIAKEKAGILKSGVPIVYDWTSTDGTAEAILKVAEAKGSPLASWSQEDDGKVATYNLPERARYFGLTPLMNVPVHVRANLAIALPATWVALQRMGRIPKRGSGKGSEDEEMLEKEMLSVVDCTMFPGRQQQIDLQRLTGRQESALLDGAHNHESALALAEAVKSLRHQHGGRPVTWVLAASSSKDAAKILSPLVQDNDDVFAVEFGPVDGMPWVKPLPGANVLKAARLVVTNAESLHTQAFKTDLRSALVAASHKADGGPLVIAGSLYLVGDVLRLLRNS